ncbi:DUF4205-containing protein [Aureococcus anophagefferens]|nr:DUF4205-containing protein [Aureococcus anophagefferens]
MGGDEWWLARELRALLEAQAAEKAEQGCEKAACPTAAEAPEKAEKGPPAPAPAPVSAARRAPGAPWDDVDDALEAVPATAQGLVRPVPVTFQSVVNSYVHWLEEHPTIGVAVCKMSRSKRKPHRSRERKELLEDGYDESQERLASGQVARLSNDELRQYLGLSGPTANVPRRRSISKDQGSQITTDRP